MMNRFVRRNAVASGGTSNIKLEANCLAELQRMKYAKDHLLARNRIDYSFRALIGRTIRQQRREERRLAEQRATTHRFQARNSCILDGRNYPSLDGYFCLPGHNFDWKHAGVDLRRSRLPLQSNDAGRLAQW